MHACAGKPELSSWAFTSRRRPARRLQEWRHWQPEQQAVSLSTSYTRLACNPSSLRTCCCKRQLAVVLSAGHLEAAFPQTRDGAWFASHSSTPLFPQTRRHSLHVRECRRLSRTRPATHLPGINLVHGRRDIEWVPKLPSPSQARPQASWTGENHGRVWAYPTETAIGRSHHRLYIPRPLCTGAWPSNICPGRVDAQHLKDTLPPPRLAVFLLPSITVKGLQVACSRGCSAHIGPLPLVRLKTY